MIYIEDIMIQYYVITYIKTHYIEDIHIIG